MTPKQLQVLRFIRDFIAREKVGPTHQQVAFGIECKARQTASAIIDLLCERGYLSKNMTAIRNIVVTSKGRKLLNQKRERGDKKL